MSAAGAVKGLIAGVVETAFAGVNVGLTIRLGAFGRMVDRDPLGIGCEPALHSCCSFRLRPLPPWRQGVLPFALIGAQLFPRRPLNRIRRAARRIRDARRGELHGRDKRSGRRSRWRDRAGGARATALWDGGVGKGAD
jgi:hypothetical protein